MAVDGVQFVKELYPRLREDDAAIERYRAAIDRLPPIVVARGRVLVDGFHRWQAYKREGLATIDAVDLGDLTDAEIVRESITRNAAHGQQLSARDKERLAGQLWRTFAHLSNGERNAEISKLLSVGERIVQLWTKDARATEKAESQARAWDAWLDCLNERQVADAVGVTQPTIGDWLKEKRKDSLFFQAPTSRQHFDVWQFSSSDDSAGAKSYFGRMPPQIVENLLWLYTEPGNIVFDPFAGSGTTIDVAKRMGRRVWASDRNPSTPTLPIHEHDITDGWPKDAPARADFILLDPPYWQQAAGEYSDSPADLGNMTADEFYAAWAELVRICKGHLTPAGRLAYIISPTQMKDGPVVDHATDMLRACWDAGLRVERRIIATYQTQQATGQQVTWARENKLLLKLYRDVVVLSCPR